MRPFCFLLFLAPFLLNAQIPVIPVFRATLPDTLPESSGLEYISDTSIWSHNDSYHPGEIFQIDTAGQLHRVIRLLNVPAVDMEDMTQDSAGWFYIGDFGNNNNDRTNQLVYKIPPPQSIAGDSIIPQIIAFGFADQDSFPPPAEEKNFDCEAMFHFGNSLYLFSKNRGASTYSRMYRMPDTVGTYSLAPVDSFDTQHYWVTSADISPNGQYMVLFSEWNMFVFSNFSGDNFFQGNVVHLTFLPYTQKEGVVFANDSTIFMTDETGYLGNGKKLYSLDLTAILTAVPLQSAQDQQVKIFPNPAADEMEIRTPFARYKWTISSAAGETVKNGFSENAACRISTNMLSPGMYFLRIESEDGRSAVLPLVRTR
ncbi:MAG: hypothetical protein FD123_2813 [Bacteroidetes bacterium]|nr:MAG: hypothetical protein FD123_2813 [Bacteroidota bacterium]